MEDTSYDSQVLELIRNNKIYRYATELQNITDEKRKKEILDIMNKLNEQNETMEEKAKKEIDQICTTLEHSIAKKKWFRLSEDMQIDKLNEYIKKHNLQDKQDQIMILYKEGKLKGKKIVYDSENMCITNIVI